MSFERLDKEELPKSAVVASFLDSHCYPPDAVNFPTSPTTMERRMKLAQNVAQERAFKSALLGSEALVVNRTYFFNKNYLSNIILSGQRENYGAVRQLLEDGSLIPFLFNESDLQERPNLAGIDEERLAAWQNLSRKCEGVKATRISWRENQASVLGKRFQSYARTTQFDVDRVCADFGLDRSVYANKIIGHLEEIKNLEPSNGRSFLGREEIYGYLLGIKLESGADPFHADMIGKLSPDRTAIRELFDIRYATNLSDVLDRFSVRGDGVPSRSVLQNDAKMARGASQYDEDQFKLISENIMLANQEFNREDVGLIMPEKLSIDDIFAIRGKAIWRDYIEIKDDFLAYDSYNLQGHPLLSSDRTRELARLRMALAREVGRRSQAAISGKWKSQFRVASQWGLFGLSTAIGGVAGAIAGLPPVSRFLERWLADKPSTWFANLEMGAMDHGGRFLQTVGEDHPMYRMILQPNDAENLINMVKDKGVNSDISLFRFESSGLGIEHKDYDN